MRIDVFTLFPEVIDHYGGSSILGRARQAARLDLRAHDIREAATDPHRSVDDAPFGGGAGMVLAAEPVFAAVEAVEAASGACPARCSCSLRPGAGSTRGWPPSWPACPPGSPCSAAGTRGSTSGWTDHLVDGELSVGDFVLAGGELAALVVVEAVARLLPGVLGNDASAGDESFADGLLEYPQFTRPATFRGWEVPEVLRSGDHGRVDRWRRAHSLARTLRHRPDLVRGPGRADRRRRSPWSPRPVRCACSAITATIVEPRRGRHAGLRAEARAIGRALRPTGEPGCPAGGDLERSVERRVP